MKHLFYIHSYITYYVSLEIVKYKEIPFPDCVFMYGRGFEPSTNSKAGTEVHLPYHHYPHNTFFLERQFWKSWSKLRKFDAFLFKLNNGDKFHLYTNQTGLDFIKLILSHAKCQGYSLIEEGLYSYYTFDIINKVICPPVGRRSMFYELLIRANFGRRLKQKRYFMESGYEAVYGIHPKAFPGFRNRHILPFPFGTVADESSTNKQAVLILDSLLDYGVIREKVFLNALQKALDYFAKYGIERLYIKFHPKQYRNPDRLAQLKKVLSTSKKAIAISEIGQKQSLELLAADASIKNLDFYVFLSSAALYATLCGRNAYSFAYFIAEEDPGFLDRINTVPQIFKDLVNFIGKPKD
ncbi:polysialyltransferase family glycosyltransferase [Pontibacter sp. 13R65]|uniref:polysialyltransferase family glycosyltransferase n=1 Tax=Pontibacter sp. 13R65 TaxID=3127458 RepID=UPI00301BE66D